MPLLLMYRRTFQVEIVLRFVDDKFNIVESFLGFYPTDQTDGESLFNLMKTALVSAGLCIADVRAQCYDGATNMRGLYSGVAARFKQENPLSFYVHCYAHVLNLCIVDACSSVAVIRNAFGVMSSLHNLLEASAKRHAIFEKFKDTNFAGGSETLKSLSDTRWSCRFEAIRAISDNFDAITKALEELAENDQKCGSQANQLLKCVQDFEFILCLFFLRRVLGQCNSLSKALQSKNLTYSNVKILANATVAALETFRSDEFFMQLWKTCKDVCENEGYGGPKKRRQQKVPGRLGGGSRLSVTEAESDEDY